MRFGKKARKKPVDRELSRRLAEEELRFKRELVQARTAAGLTAEQVAHIIGVNVKAISEFERLDSNPTLSMVRYYAHAVGALVTWGVQPQWSGKVMDLTDFTVSSSGVVTEMERIRPSIDIHYSAGAVGDATVIEPARTGGTYLRTNFLWGRPAE
ncbi:helix-turn-helix transcriptional regulator [Nocardia takedensis]